MKLLISPTFEEEHILVKQGYRFIAGVDEVGRGSFAGPIVAAAVVLPPHFPEDTGINDSKLLLPKKREELAGIIKNLAVCYAISEVTVSYINKNGIGKANQIVIRKAVYMLQKNLFNTLKFDYSNNRTKLLYVLIDGFSVGHLRGFGKESQKALIHGDRRSISIAAASILAKVHRDRIMSTLPERYAKYKFHVHKGYGTEAHRRMIAEYGLCNIHRTSFNLRKYTAA